MTDIRKFAVKQYARLVLVDGNGDKMYSDSGKEMAINLYGPGSKQYAKAHADQNNRFTDRLKKKGKADQTAEQLAAEKATFLADCTHSFENIAYDELQGRALHEAVYADYSIGFIAEQANQFFGDWANFTNPSMQSANSISGS